jgi:4-hydroxy-3-polyprenylbenzoate decarboxylase
MRVVLGITGASGAIYGIRLASTLRKTGTELTIIVSDAAKQVLDVETPDELKELEGYDKLFSEHYLDAAVSSGSARTDAVVVCPCSMKTLAAVANGYAYNLICRAADVAIKEQQKLVLVVREMPLSAIHLENMLKLARLGVVIIPASPGFYHQPKTVDDMVNHVVGKVLDALGVSSDIYKRWAG